MISCYLLDSPVQFPSLFYFDVNNIALLLSLYPLFSAFLLFSCFLVSYNPVHLIYYCFNLFYIVSSRFSPYSGLSVSVIPSLLWWCSCLIFLSPSLTVSLSPISPRPRLAADPIRPQQSTGLSQSGPAAASCPPAGVL